jgi:hypothetical protein
MSLLKSRSEKFKMNNSCTRFYTIDGEKPISLNEAYLTKQARPKDSASWMNTIWRRKTAEATYYQWLIQDTMALVDRKFKSKLKIPQATHFEGIALTVVFFIPPKEIRIQDGSKFKGRDVSNYIKLIEDAVFEYLGRTDNQTFPAERAKIEDAASIEPLAFKRLSFDDDWHIHIYVSTLSSATDAYIYCSGIIQAYPGVKPTHSRSV